MFPKVSVVIPAYNAGRYISQAVESVLAQSYPNLECIVVNDGSTDDTEERLRAYKGKIIYVYQANRGRTAARNVGIAHATGCYIASLDADDYWHPDKLVKQVTLLEADVSLGAVGCGAFLVTEAGSLVRELRAANLARLPAGKQGFELLITQGYEIAAPLTTLVFRSAALREAGGFAEEALTMDEWDLLLRMCHKWEIGCVFEPLAYYRTYGFLLAKKYSPTIRRREYLRVINRSFDALEPTNENKLLKQRALGVAFLLLALAYYSAGDLIEGKETLYQAYSYQPQLFLSPQSQFIERLGYFSVYQYDNVTPFSEAVCLVNKVFDNLPDEMTHLARMRQDALNLTCKIWCFDNYQRGQLHELRRIAPWLLCNNSTAFRDRGLRSILFEAFTGSTIANWVRRALT